MSAPLDNPRYGFVVGENGRRTGLAISQIGDVELRVLVLPKMWSADKSTQARWVCETGRKGALRVSIVCHEGNRVLLSRDLLGTRSAHWPDLLKCCEGITTTADALQTQRGHRKSALVRHTMDRVCEPKDFHGGREPQVEIWNSWRDFLNLWYRSRLLWPLRKPLLRQLGDVSALASQDSLLAPLVRSAFVSEVERVVTDMRPGYVRVTAPSHFVRGRMDMVSAAVAILGGRDTVMCTYDAFGLDTLLLRVVAAALRVVADGTGTDELPTAPLAAGGAAWLLGKLEAVQYMPRDAALRLGRALLPRLARVDRSWQNALRLACMVLASEGLDPIADTERGDLGWHEQASRSYVFDINTATLWEHVVRQAWWCEAEKLEGFFAWERDKAFRGKRRRRMQADICAKDRSSVADVKYKAFDTDPSAADSRQAFVFSHVYDVEHVFVVYALTSNAVSPKSGGALLRNECSRPARVTLKTLGVSFPQPCDARDERAWKSYTTRLGQQLIKARDMTSP